VHLDESHARGRDCLTVLASLILITGLAGCSSVRTSGDPGHGNVLKRTANVVVVGAVSLLTGSNGGTVENVWQDGSGMWHWTRVERGVGTFKCEGYRLGVPKFCDRISS
jgi:hypothetical protein